MHLLNNINKQAMTYMILAVIFFALYSNIIAVVDADNILLFAIPSLGLLIGCSIYLILAKIKFKFNFKIVIILGSLEAIQSILYIIGLKVGVISLVAAAHMTVPLWFLLYLVFTRQRKFGKNEIIAFSLLAISLIIVGLAPNNNSGDAYLGIAFGLLSGMFLSILLYYISEIGQKDNVLSYIPAKSLFVFLLTIPFLIFVADFNTINNNELLILFLNGLVILSLAAILEWIAIPKLPKVLFSSLILLEIPFTSLWAYLVFSEPFNLLYLLSSLILLIAIYIEIKQTANQEPLIEHPLG